VSPRVMPMLMTHLTGTSGSFIRRASLLNERRWDRENTTVMLMRLRFINPAFMIPGPFSNGRLSFLSGLSSRESNADTHLASCSEKDRERERERERDLSQRAQRVDRLIFR